MTQVRMSMARCYSVGPKIVGHAALGLSNAERRTEG